MMSMDMSERDACSAADVETLRRAEDLAWEFEKSQDQIINQCLRYGLRNYELALEIEGDD